MNKAEILAVAAGKAEGKIEAGALAEEIGVAVNGLFEGELEINGAALCFKFLNGQSFIVKVEEVR
ncbi:MAG: hypothetical protein NC489_43555 [Ruminococcus flavefaciens]|nr:hypothetical protein [Ruminococcus flavefaciens]